MNAGRPNRNEPQSGAQSAESKPDDDAPIGVDPDTLEKDLAQYGGLIANTKDVVERNVNTPLTVSRFGFVNALLRTITRRTD